MALITCPECGKEFSDKAAACPNCAYPITEILKSQKATENEKQSELTGESEELKPISMGAPAYKTINGTENPLTGELPGNSGMLTHVQGQTNNLVQDQLEGLSGTLYGGVQNRPAYAPKPLPLPKKRKTGLIIGIALAVVVAIGLGVFFIIRSGAERTKKEYETAIKDYTRGDYEKAIDEFTELDGYEESKKYIAVCEAKQFCQTGKYENAFDEIRDIPDFAEAKTLMKQIYYESRLFEGISDMRSHYKNPESLQVNNVDTYLLAGTKEPIFVVTSSGQNGFGGYSSSYCLIMESKDSGKYEYLGSCNSLDEDDYDYSKDDDYVKLLILKTIKLLQSDGTKLEGIADYERVKNIVQGGNYSGISRVKDLTEDMFKDTSNVTGAADPATTEE